ncbi:MAG: DUF4893 domain-containing protein [Myxococcales bacterium]|jgi:hypothetical protein
MRAPILLAALLACSSCSVIEQPSGMIPRWTLAWKDVVTADDRERLRDWRATFVAAVNAARATHAAEVAREGVLLDPDAAMPGAALPEGTFRCRVLKLGAKQPGNLGYVTYPPFTCRVKAERGLKRFNKLSGSQRYVGLIFPNDTMREIFLGTLVLGDEKRALQYGQDQTRDIAGYVEHIGPNHWRLVMPKPHFESQLDVMELVPVSG